MTFRSDRSRTAQRVAELEHYMSTNVTSGPGGFCCTSYGQCHSSAVRSAKVEFFEGQLSHVGEHYDLTEDGRDLRVLVLGMETGRRRTDVTLAERTAEQQPVIDEKPRSRKAHMKGTASALRLAFGRTPGPDVAGELLIVGNESVHVMNAYALANVRLCSAVRAGTTQSKGTPEMTRQCAPHLAATIRILQPDLIVTQSVRIREEMTPIIDDAEAVGERLEHVTLAGRQLLLASFCHPHQQGHNSEKNWGRSFDTTYLVDVVTPTIQMARELLLAVPADTPRTAVEQRTYGGWLSRRHFAVARSMPLVTGASVDRVEVALRRAVSTFRPAPVIAGRVGTAWFLEYFVEKHGLRDPGRVQAQKYEDLRDGERAWDSTMGEVPPSSETSPVTVDLGA